ncbi:MAG: aminotransferase class I/II-fold pyridoxal phosphate-dependent enzyme, partial [Pseudomonadota bacterium]
TAIGTNPTALLLSPGSELLIRLLPDIIAPRSVTILSPTYGDHAEVWKRSRADIVETSDPLAFAETADAIVLTHPNNPDGRYFDLGELNAVRKTLADRSGWLIIDEAYADLLPEQSMAKRGGMEGLIILRSFGKVFGLAGVRLGALIAPEPIIARMKDRLGVWPISGTALTVGARAYTDTAWQQQTRERLKAAAERLDTILIEAGLSPTGGTSLYRFVETPDAYALFDHLAQAGIYIRRFDWSRRHVRMGLPLDADAESRLAAALSLSA